MHLHNSTLKITFTIGISLVWLINGLFCKVLNLVPRHQLIVSRILGIDYSALLTKTIGALEILMVVWIVSGIKSRWCAIVQILIVAIMNSIEFIVVPDLLLYGRWNAALAVLFMLIVYVNEFIINNKIHPAIRIIQP